jgi:hypothetical protein
MSPWGLYGAGCRVGRLVGTSACRSWADLPARTPGLGVVMKYGQGTGRGQWGGSTEGDRHNIPSDGKPWASLSVTVDTKADGEARRRGCRWRCSAIP